MSASVPILCLLSGAAQAAQNLMMMPLSLMMLPLAFAEKDACEDDDGAAATAAAAADGGDARAEWHCGNDAFVNEPNTYPHGQLVTQLAMMMGLGPTVVAG